MMIIPSISTVSISDTDIAEKEKWRLKEILQPGDHYQGYAFRTQAQNTYAELPMQLITEFLCLFYQSQLPPTGY